MSRFLRDILCKWTCPNCGKENYDRKKICWSCLAPKP